MSEVGDLGINILASVIVGVAVWAFGRWRRRLRESRRRTFLGLARVRECVISIPRHAGSSHSRSVNRNDVAALIELAALVKERGAAVDLRVPGEDASFDGRFGRKTEFCVGGPDGNARTGEHLRTFVPGFTIDRFADVEHALTIHVGGQEFPCVAGETEYVALVKTTELDAPVFLVCGQSAISNSAAGRYLAQNLDTLARERDAGPFCLMLKVVNSDAFGDRVVRRVGDFTTAAFATAPNRA